MSLRQRQQAIRTFNNRFRINLNDGTVAVLIFRKLKQPLVLGYLIAGFLAGNHFDFFPSVKDIKSVEVWAEIGIIFLLFSLGLEFSFKKLMKVGGTASITAGIQIVSMCILGYAVGQWLGWPKMDSIFLGVILSISSTTIILKSFDELGVKTQKFAGIVIGSLNRSRHTCHINDGFIIHDCREQSVFWRRSFNVGIKTALLSRALVSGRDFYYSNSTQKNQTFTHR